MRKIILLVVAACFLMTLPAYANSKRKQSGIKRSKVNRLFVIMNLYDVYSEVIRGYRIAYSDLYAMVDPGDTDYGKLATDIDSSKNEAWGRQEDLKTKDPTSYGKLELDLNKNEAWGKQRPKEPEDKTTYGKIATKTDPGKPDAWGKNSQKDNMITPVNYQRGKRNHFHY